jgi:hypothetical protein
VINDISRYGDLVLLAESDSTCDGLSLGCGVEERLHDEDPICGREIQPWYLSAEFERKPVDELTQMHLCR